MPDSSSNDVEPPVSPTTIANDLPFELPLQYIFAQPPDDDFGLEIYNPVTAAEPYITSYANIPHILSETTHAAEPISPQSQKRKYSFIPGTILTM